MRHHPIASTTAAVLATVLTVIPAFADDWPQWRGQQRDGHSAETGLLSEWPEGGPALAFRSAGLGKGYSSLAVAGDRIYTTGDIGETQYLIAVGRSDGAPLWKTAIGPIWEDKFVGARSTPTVDGDRVYALSTEGDLVCLDTGAGKELWRRSLTKDFGGAVMKYDNKVDWKWVESPLIDGDRVVVTPGGKDTAMVALDKKTGKELWRAKLPDLGEKGADGAGYSSIVVSEAAGVRQYVQLLGRGLIGVEAATGRFLWGYNPVANNVANIPTPIVHGDTVFTTTGYETGGALVQLSAVEAGEGKSAGVEAKEVYFLEPKTFQNHHGGVIRHEGYLYAGSGHNKGFPICIEEKTGKVMWGPIRNTGKGSAAMSFADGHLYFRYQGGTMVLAEATPEGYREKGSFTIPDVDQFSWAHPVIADGMLYLREQDHLFVYRIKAN